MEETKTLTFTGAEFFSQAAVYLLRREAVVLYVGATKNIYKRFSVHHVLQRHVVEDTDTIEIIFCANKAAAFALERLLIKINRPKWNGTQGRGHKGSSFSAPRTFTEREQSKSLDKLLDGVSLPKGLDFRTMDALMRNKK